MAAFATLGLVTSCNQDDSESTKYSNNEIGVHASLGDNTTRAVETTISNLGSFTLNTFQDGEDNYMRDVKYSSTDGSTWTTEAGKFFWPVEGDLHFYGYAPETPGQSGTFKIDKDAQTLTDFSPNAAASEQKDFVYTSATGNGSSNGETGIDLNFKHALTEISISAKNSNTAYTVTVSGVRIGNVKTKGTFTFPSTTGTDASWSLSDKTSDKGNYETTWTEGVTLGGDVSTLDESNVPFMIIPQSLTSTTKYADGNYIAMKVKITMQGGKVLHDGWAYIGIDTNWEMGKHYVYTLDFSNGAGQDDNGKDIISGKNIKLNVSITPWNERTVELSQKFISGTVKDMSSFDIEMRGKKKHITPDINGNFKCDITGIDFTNMQAMFQLNKSLTTLDLSQLNTSNVTNMASMFNRCSSLTTLDLSNWDTRNVTVINEMFYACNSLKNLDVNHFNTSKIKRFAGMFQGCSSLTALDLSNWDTSNVKGMENMFEWCESLTTLDLSNFNTSKVNDMDYMFHYCKSLTTLDLSNWDTSNVYSMINMFYACKSLKNLDVSHFNTNNVGSMFGVFDSCSSLMTLDLSNWDTSKVNSMCNMFYNCASLRTLDLSHFDTRNVTEMSSMFSGCTTLKTLDLSNFDTSKVTDIHGMFQGCSNLTTLDLSNWNTSNVSAIREMFKDCKKLTTIYVDNCDASTIEKIKSAVKSAGLSEDIVKTRK